MKSAFKSFDYFRKTSPDHIRSTRTGGLVSICCVITIVYLTVSMYNEYLKPKMERGSHITTNREESEAPIPINVDLVFPSYPCEFITLSATSGFKDISANDLYNQLQRTRVRTSGTSVKNVGEYKSGDAASTKKELMEKIQNNEGCRVHGVYTTWKLLGVINVNTEGGFALA